MQINSSARALLSASLLPTLLLLAAPLAAAAADYAPAPAFELPRRGAAGRVSLSDLRGRIVVLDFFAYWCAPCVGASAEMEKGIAEYYAERKGNSRGIAVEMLPVSVEASHPEMTDTFIRRAGLKAVLDDPQGKVFGAYGGAAMPYVVVIDGSVSPARIVYAKAGFEGVAKLRQVIDGIPYGLSRLLPGESSVVFGGAALRNASVDASILETSDILLMDEHVEYRQSGAASQFSLALSHGYIGIHYQPESLIEKTKDVATDNYGFQTSARAQASDRWTVLAGGGAYNGYEDYRSLWFNEHYRQLFAGRKGYEKAHPWGANVSMGARWEYLPAAGFVQGEILAQHDVISPGYDVTIIKLPPQLVRFPDNFNTLSGRLTFENVLTEHLRALQEVQAADTTDRQLRFSLQSSLNWAVTERWVARVVASGTRESPQFEAASFSALVGRDWNDTWILSLIARGYWDDGEIEDALLAANTADPPLKTFLTGLELRWQGRKSFLKLFAGPYWTEYQQTGTALTTFPHLYQNREWLCAQLAYAYQF